MRKRFISRMLLSRYTIYIKKRFFVFLCLGIPPLIVAIDIIILQPDIYEHLSTDSLLGLFALLWAVSAWFQGFGRVRGLAYYLSPEDVRAKLERHFKSAFQGRIAVFIKSGYWMSLFLMLVAAFLLIGSAFHSNSDVTRLLKDNNQNIQQLSDKIDTLSDKIESNTNAIRDSIRTNQENIDNLIQRIDKLLILMEAQNDAGNITTTK